jgi:superfamily I DNA/RNA helicase
MNETWWVDIAELDDKQKDVIGLSLDGNYLIIGPPGSGKTNLLLLRANYLCLANRPNVLILVFTRMLKEFIASGASHYNLSPDKIQTYNSWAYKLLRDNGIEIESSGDFDKSRTNLFKQLRHLANNEQISGLYDVILLDESHDLFPHEIDLLRQFGTNIFAVADARQQIYRRDQIVDYIKSIMDETIELETHYRNGRMICRLADNIMKGKGIHHALEPTSMYDEIARPSRVQHFRYSDINEQCERIIAEVETQLQAYPEELIGIIAPTRQALTQIINILSNSKIAARCVFQDFDSGYESFDPERPICVSTLHSAKGLEFRALHFAACETLRKFGPNRHMAFTGVTRAKTSLSLYYSADLLPYLEGAIAALFPRKNLPNIAEAFGRGK